MDELATAKKSSTKITIRGYVLDFYGQVSNSKVMELLEEARWNHYDGLFEKGIFLDLGLALVLVHSDISYSRPLRLGEVFDIFTSVEQIGNKSITLHQQMILRDPKELAIDAKMTYVIKDMEKEVAIPLTGKMRQWLLRGE